MSLSDEDTILTERPRAPAGNPAEPPRRTAADPVRIGKYEIVQPLGRGGMGAVYRAFDPVLERDVALKVMLPETAGDPEQKQRFEREARAVARLSHPGIVTVFDLGYHTDGSPYIVMELLKGQDLLARLRESPPLSLAQKVGIVAQVLDGLGHAHKAGIVHRDIKPANVFLCEGDVARIMDFGIAFCTATGGTSKTVLGTVGYMSPEQVHGHVVDGRSDIFSVGTMLHELLSGRRPFDAETPMATFYRIAQGKSEIALPPGPEYAPFLPVVERALRASLDERFPTAAEFASALRACLQSPQATGAAPAVPAPVEAATETPAPKTDPSRLFALLREVYVGGKSGHIHLAVAGERKSLGMRRGQIVHGTSDTLGEHMGDVLVRYGIVSHDDRERALAVVRRERRRLGVVLKELGVLDQARVEEAVGLHVREILFGAISRPGLTCSFEELDESLIETTLGSSVSTGQLILDATRRILDPELVRTVLGDLGRVLVLSPNPSLRTQRITLTPADGFVLSRIDGSSSARDVMALVPLPAEEAERSLFSLLCTGVIDYASLSATQRRRMATPAPAASASAANPFAATGTAPLTPPGGPLHTAPVTPRPPATTAPASGAARPEPPAQARPAAASGAPPAGPEAVRTLIEETHALLRRDHFEVLGVDRGATTGEIRDAYGRFARLLHPDASRPPGLQDLDEKREAVFIRVTQAYEVLRDGEARAAYERAYEPSKLARPRPRPAPDRDPGPAAEPPRPPETRPAEADAPPADSGTAVAAGPSEPATAGVDPRLQPEHVLQVAHALFSAKKYWDAIQQLEPLLPRAEGTTLAQGRLLLARAYLKNPLWKRRAEGVLQSALDANPRDLAACLLLAELYRDARLITRARSLYHKALAIEPGHAAAREGLEALEPAGAGT